MYIRIADVVKLSSLKNFTLLAGESGFDNEVSTVCLADLEVDNNLIPFANGFRRGAFVLASMRESAQSKNVKLMDVIKRLIDSSCAGLAISSRMTKKPTKEIIEFCNKEGFPLFSFDSKEIYVENVVFEIMNAVQESSVSFSMVKEVRMMLKDTMDRDTVIKIARTINPEFLRYSSVSYIKAKNASSDFSPGMVARNYSVESEDRETVVSLLAFKEGLIVIVSANVMDYKFRNDVIKDIIKTTNQRNKVVVATGEFHLTDEELDKSFRECNHAYVAGRVENLDWVDYEDIGIYKFLVPHSNSPEMVSFVKRYLDSMTEEQLNTAIEFVKCNGNYDDTAKKLICHRNTVRYRISKIQEKTDANMSEFKFYENLAAAIRVYMINNVYGR